jgi:hypothetical protein
MLILWQPVSTSNIGDHQAIIQEHECIKVKLKVTLEEAKKAHRRRRHIALLLL